MPLASGTKLDGYEILSLLGSGGMGEVYRARDPALRREVAIKVLPSYFSGDPDRLRRFEQEAHAAAALSHPNILSVHQFGVFHAAPYLVTELMEGSTLREVLRHGAIPARKAIEYAVQIAHGLAAAHDKGIVHRDLKPGNLFVTKDGRVKILDFGLARLTPRRADRDADAPTQTAVTDPGMVMGTAAYMSPEQVRGERVDHRTDIFALGVILCEMLTGKRAFQRSTSAETMTSILRDEPQSISQIAQTAAPALQRVVHRCLEKNPQQRFHDAADVAYALEALSEPGSASSVAIEGRGWRSRRPWALAAGVALLLIAGLFVRWRMRDGAPVVESITQLTDDGQSKAYMVTDGMRIYFRAPEPATLRQVSVTGGATAPVEMAFLQTYVSGITRDGSALLVVIRDAVDPSPFSLWLIPLPAGEGHRLRSISGVNNADMFPDGRIVYAIPIQGTDPTGPDNRTDWFVAEKNGSNPRKVVSLPGPAGTVTVSPDGERLVLTQEQTGDRRLFEIAVDGTGLREILKLGESEQNFRWSSDGRYLMYQSAPNVWLLPMDTGLFGRAGKPRRLTNGPLAYTFPCPSRDGKQIFVLGAKQRGELVRYDMKSGQFVPLLGGISATDPTFSRDGKWVAYATYPEHTIWRSRSDGSERMQLTFPPMDARFPFISQDGTKVAFHTVTNELYVVNMEGGTPPQKIANDTFYANWSPDGNYLFNSSASPPFQKRITDVRSGKSFPIPSSSGVAEGFWPAQDTLVGPNPAYAGVVAYNLKTRQLTNLTPSVPGGIEHWMISPDGKYLYLTTRGAEAKAIRVRVADHQVETIVSLKGFHRVVNHGDTQINVAPDGSPVFTRDSGYEEIYALNVRWP
jgi:serine/threonine protein kinase/Tol biopolymer transport system component